MSNQPLGNLSDLLGIEKVEQEATQSAEASTSEDATSEDTSAKTEDKDILDLLSEDDEGDEPEESTEEGQETTGAQKRIQQLVTQRNSEKEARQDAEAQLESYSDLGEFLTETYGEQESFEALRQDVAFLRAMVSLSNKDENVRNTVQMVRDFRDGKLAVKEQRGNMTTAHSDNNRGSETAIAKEMWSDRIDAVLSDNRIPSEVRNLVARQAKSDFDPGRISKAHAEEAVVEILKESGWKPKAADKTAKAKPPTVGSKRTATTNSTTHKADGVPKSGTPTNAREYHELLERQFQEQLNKS